MPPKKLKRLKNDSLSTPDNSNKDTCFLNEIPYEIMEMIFGKVNFIDLPNLLRVSRGINLAFNGTKYSRQLRVIQKYQKPLKELYRNLKSNPHVEWPVDDVLQAFTDNYCECGKYGILYFFWIHTPIKKICSDCLFKSEYQCNKTTIMFRHYQLTKRDIKHLPTTIADSRASTTFRNGTIVAVQSEIEKIAIRKHGKEFDSLPLPQFPRSGEWSYRRRLGFTNVTYSVQDDAIYLPLLCEGCVDEFGRRYMMPRNYMSLRNHIASVHQNILKDFEAGWKRLGPRIQRKWQKGVIYDPTYRGDSTPYRFESWTFVLNSEMDITCPYPSQLEDDFSDWLRAIQEKEGSFYKVPEISGFAQHSNLTWDVKNRVARVAATTMLSREIQKIVERLKGEIEMNGLDFIRQYFPDLFPAKEMNKIEEYMADHN